MQLVTGVRACAHAGQKPPRLFKCAELRGRVLGLGFLGLGLGLGNPVVLLWHALNLELLAPMIPQGKLISTANCSCGHSS